MIAPWVRYYHALPDARARIITGRQCYHIRRSSERTLAIHRRRIHVLPLTTGTAMGSHTCARFSDEQDSNDVKPQGTYCYRRKHAQALVSAVESMRGVTWHIVYPAVRPTTPPSSTSSKSLSVRQTMAELFGSILVQVRLLL